MASVKKFIISGLFLTVSLTECMEKQQRWIRKSQRPKTLSTEYEIQNSSCQQTVWLTPEEMNNYAKSVPTNSDVRRKNGIVSPAPKQ